MKSLVFTTLLIFISKLLCSGFVVKQIPLLFSCSNNNKVKRSLIQTLGAKNTNKNKKRMGLDGGGGTCSPRGSGRRRNARRKNKLEDGKTEDCGPDFGTSKDTGVGAEAGTGIGIDKTSQRFCREPRKVKKQIISLERSQQFSQLTVCIMEVNDIEWWNNVDNPYGARLWPSGLALAQCLARIGNLEDTDLLDIGCGNGLISIVAAECGARVVASDISNITLKLTKSGWIETCKRRNRKIEKLKHKSLNKEEVHMNNNNVSTEVISLETVNPGTLNTFNFDIFSKRNLPMSSTQGRKRIVTATAMMYEAALAQALARRAIEACERGAWVIIGDDDTGEREGGRKIFEAELDKVEKERNLKFVRVWKQSSVKYAPLGWSQKAVVTLHMNPPEDMML